jgi:hypothetical protein
VGDWTLAADREQTHWLRPNRSLARAIQKLNDGSKVPMTPDRPATEPTRPRTPTPKRARQRRVVCIWYDTETRRNRHSGRLREATTHEYEDFSALGGITRTHSRTDDADICRRQHEQGVTCVANSSRNRAAVTALVARARTTRVEAPTS